MTNQTCVRLDDEMYENLGTVQHLLASSQLPPESVQCYLSWLNKLTSCLPAERILRNKYVSEIVRQLQAGVIAPPFDDLPKVGTLAPINFQRQDKMDEDHHSQLSDITEVSEVSAVSALSSARRQALQAIKEYQTHDEPETLAIVDSELDHLQSSDKLERCVETINQQKALISHYQQAMDYFLRHGESNEPRCDDRQEKLGKLYEEKIGFMLATIASIRNRNEDLNDELMKSDDPNISWIQRNFENEIWSLTKSIEDLEKLKAAQDRVTRESYLLRQHDMSVKLAHATQQLHDQEPRYTHLADNMQAVTRQLQLAKEREDEYKMAIENKNKDFKLVMEEVKKRHEWEMKEIEEKQRRYAEQLAARDEEIIKLKTMLKESCLKMQTDVDMIRKNIEESTALKEQRLSVRIEELQSTIQAQEEMKQKTLESFSVKLNKVLREKDLEVAKLKILLKTQKADLLMAMSAERQVEFETIVSKLEDKYRNVIKNRDEVALQHKERDMGRIKELEAMLCSSAKHSAPRYKSTDY